MKLIKSAMALLTSDGGITSAILHFILKMHIKDLLIGTKMSHKSGSAGKLKQLIRT